MSGSKCYSCGYLISGDWKVCPECGAPLKGRCVSCGSVIESQWKVCPMCGTFRKSSSADPSSAQVLLPGNVPLELVQVPAGSFIMGSDAFYKEPAHQVYLDEFWIGKYPVTQEQWQAIMGSNPSEFKGGMLPVENVSWGDCQSFIKKLNTRLRGKGYRLRLPTDAEWEYAARGGNQSRGYKYAGSNIIDEAAWYEENSGDTPHPVGQKAPNELDLYDMSGNVWEWVQDWYVEDYYNKSPNHNPLGPANGSRRVIRGGSYYWGDGYCKSTHRSNNTPGYRFSDIGFRVLAVQE